MKRAATYNVINDFSPTDGKSVSFSPYWIVAIIPLGAPITFSRDTQSSISKDVTIGALSKRRKPLIITNDCINLQITNAKANHTKSLVAAFKQTDVNYINEINPDDWIMGWMFNNHEDFVNISKKISELKPCNGAKDRI